MVLSRLFFVPVFVLASLQVITGEQSLYLSSISVDNDNSTLTISVQYSSDTQPEARWTLSTFTASGLLDLDLHQNDPFMDGRGETTVRISHETARRFMPDRLLVLAHPDNRIKILFPKLPVLINKGHFVENFANLGIGISKDGQSIHTGTVVEYDPQSYGIIDLEVSVESSALSNYSVSDFYCSLETFDYSGGLPVMQDESAYPAFLGKYTRVTLEGRGWSGGQTRKTRRISAYPRRGSLTGTLDCFSVGVRPDRGFESLIASASYSFNVYFRSQDENAPVRENSVFIDTSHSHYLTDYDIPINLVAPMITVKAYGNPLPSLALYRACAEVLPPEVSFTEEIWSQYQTLRRYRFENATAAIQGSYTLVARSGTTEVREVLSIGGLVS